MLEGHLPLPSYLCSEGTPMVPGEHAALLDLAGGPGGVRDWFLTWWDDDERDVATTEWSAYVLLPMTNHDRLRFGAPPPRETWVDDVRRRWLTPTPPDLPLRTRRLVLRRPELRDVDAIHAYYGNPEATAFLLHHRMSYGEVEARVRKAVSQPYSPSVLSLVLELDGQVVGDVVLFLEAPSYDTAQVGWIINPAHAGKGLATEAARALSTSRSTTMPCTGYGPSSTLATGPPLRWPSDWG